MRAVVYRAVLHLSNDEIGALKEFYREVLADNLTDDELRQALAIVLTKKYLRSGEMYKKLSGLVNDTVSSVSSALTSRVTSSLEKIKDLASRYYSNAGITYKTSKLEPADYANVEMLRKYGYIASSRLGRGSYGRVYLTEKDGQLDAIKVMDNTSKRYTVLFDTEVSILQDITHAAKHLDCNYSICLKSYFIHEDKYILIMDYIDGVTLLEYIKRLKERSISAPAQKRYSIMLSLARGVGILHDDLEYVHRDLKPANMMVVTAATGSIEPYVKLLDLGMACSGNSNKKFACASLPSQEHRGSPAYNAPELWYTNSKRVNLPIDNYYKIDVFAIGCIFYELITGEVMFGHDPKTTALIAQKLIKFARQPALYALLTAMLAEYQPVRISTRDLINKLETRRHEIAIELEELETQSILVVPGASGSGGVAVAGAISSYHGNVPPPACAVINNTGSSCVDSQFDPVV
jgi:serine/threonine protein kinase